MNNSIDHPEGQVGKMQANREELLERITRVLPVDGAIHPLNGLHLFRISAPQKPIHLVFEPSLCVTVQGSKEFLLGDSHYQYDPAHYLIVAVDLPYVGQILEASKERPYISLTIDLEPTLVGSMMAEAGFAELPDLADVRALDVSPLDANLQDAIVRLVRLLDTPAEAPILTPLVMREIVYRLLMGRQSARLRHLAVTQGYTSVIARAVKRLQQDFDQPLHVEDLARELGMSVSGLHHHFKAATAMSPLQFQKQIRLQEARRLMLSNGFDATSAAARVGYYDPSHFSREYRSLFGAPPMRDVQRLRREALVSTDQRQA